MGMEWLGWNGWGWNGWGWPTTITANTTANLTSKTSFNNPITMVYP